MKIADRGVIEPSFMDFTTPSEFARTSLYYVSRYGHFYCTNDYIVERNYVDSFLLIYVCQGHLQIEAKEQTDRKSVV